MTTVLHQEEEDSILLGVYVLLGRHMLDARRI